MTVKEMMLAQAGMGKERGVRIAQAVLQAQGTWAGWAQPARYAAIAAAEEVATIAEGGLKLVKRG